LNRIPTVKGFPAFTFVVSAIRLASALGGNPKNCASDLWEQNKSARTLRMSEGSLR
jgi:hypothetical protein